MRLDCGGFELAWPIFSSSFYDSLDRWRNELTISVTLRCRSNSSRAYLRDSALVWGSAMRPVCRHMVRYKASAFVLWRNWIFELSNMNCDCTSVNWLWTCNIHDQGLSLAWAERPAVWWRSHGWDAAGGCRESLRIIHGPRIDYVTGKIRKKGKGKENIGFFFLAN